MLTNWLVIFKQVIFKVTFKQASGQVCGKIFWQSRGTGFQPVEFDTGKMPVPRWHPSARESCHTPGRTFRRGQETRAERWTGEINKIPVQTAIAL